MEVIYALIGIAVVLWAVIKYQEVRANRFLEAVWAIQTSLPDEHVSELITKAMKGMNPMASISRPQPGVYEREVARGIGERSRNHSVFTTTVTRADGNPNEFVVHCEIKQWRGPGFLGIKAMNSVFKARRRIDAIIRAIQAADPSATVLAHPKLQPALPETTGV
jgi:hypothetical protein